MLPSSCNVGKTDRIRRVSDSPITLGFALVGLGFGQPSPWVDSRRDSPAQSSCMNSSSVRIWISVPLSASSAALRILPLRPSARSLRGSWTPTTR